MSKRKKNPRDLAARGFCPSCSKSTKQGPYLRGANVFLYVCDRCPETMLLATSPDQDFIELSPGQWRAIENWHAEHMGAIYEFEERTMASIHQEFPKMLVRILTPRGARTGTA